MKIGVLGLRPRQKNDLDARGYNCEISYHDKSRGTDSVSAFIRSNQLVIVQSGAVPSNLLGVIASADNVVLNRATSVSSLVRIIEEKMLEAGLPLYKQMPSKEKPATAVSKPQPPAAYAPRKVKSALVTKDNIRNDPSVGGKVVLGDALLSALKTSDIQIPVATPTPAPAPAPYVDEELVLMPTGYDYEFGSSGYAETHIRSWPLDLGHVVNVMRKTPMYKEVRFNAKLNAHQSVWIEEITSVIRMYSKLEDGEVAAMVDRNIAYFVAMPAAKETSTPAQTVVSAPAPTPAPAPAPAAVVVEDSAVPVGPNCLGIFGDTATCTYSGWVSDRTIHGEGNSVGRVDYTVVRNTPAGETVRLARPNGVREDSWVGRCRSALSNLSKYGVFAIVAVYKDYADFQVYKNRQVGLGAKVADVRSDTDVIQPVVKAPEVLVSKEMTFDDLDSPAPKGTQDVSSVETMGMKFWCEVFIDAKSDFDKASQCAVVADEALAEFRKRFG